MPNHCFNTLTIAGSMKDLKVIKKELIGEEYKITGTNHLKNPPPISFDRIVKMPEGLIGGGGCNDWAVENWGTKWDAYDYPEEHPEIQTPPNSIRFIIGEEGLSLLSYTFVTAWSPPQPVILAISLKYPEVILRHSYIEEGCAFAGIEFLKKGSLLHEVDCINTKYLREKCYKLGTFEQLIREFKKVIKWNL